MNKLKFSVVSLVSDTRAAVVRDLIDSLRSQEVTSWHLTLVNRSVFREDTQILLGHFRDLDSRISILPGRPERAPGEDLLALIDEQIGESLIVISDRLALAPGLLSQLASKGHLSAPTGAGLLVSAGEQIDSGSLRTVSYSPQAVVIPNAPGSFSHLVLSQFSSIPMAALLYTAAANCGRLNLIDGAVKRLDQAEQIGPFNEEILRSSRSRLCERLFGATRLNVPIVRKRLAGHRPENEERPVMDPAIEAKSSEKRALRYPKVFSKVASLIEDSGLFDRDYYLSAWRDHMGKERDPLLHFVKRGWMEGCNPHPLFSIREYWARYPDIKIAGVNPLEHFLLSGDGENRRPHPLFDMEFYRTQVGAAHLDGENPLVHFIRRGWRDNVSPHPLVDLSYIRCHGGTDLNGHNPLTYYLEKGWREGVDPHPLFNRRYYLRKVSSDYDGVSDPLLYFLAIGGIRGEDPHPLFDSDFYLSEQQDLISAGVNPLVHYLMNGEREDRRPHRWFDPGFYKLAHGYLLCDGIGPLRHFVERGHLMGLKTAVGVDLGGWLAAEMKVEDPIDLMDRFYNDRHIDRLVA